MKIYIISDTHFGHDKIIEYCKRPSNHEQLIYQGIAGLGREDCLIHLGDFCMGNDETNHTQYLNDVVCRKIFVIGNHDNKSWSWYMEHGWDFVCDSFKLKYAGKIIMFSHKPVPWDGDWEINVHGHLHNLPQLSHHMKEFRELQQWHRVYAPELMNYRPIELAQFIQDMRYAGKKAV